MEKYSRSDFLYGKGMPLKLLRRDPQEDFSLHSHEFSELVIVYRGTGTHLIYGERRPISAGDVFLIQRETRHGYENSDHLALYNILFDLHDADSPLAALCRYPVLRTLFLLEPGFTINRGLRLPPSELPSVLQILEAIEEEQNSRKEDHAVAMSAWFVLLTVTLSRLYDTAEHPGNTETFEIQRLINAVSDRSGEHWDRASMAKQAGMSVSTLTRRFKKATGYPPNEYLLMLRLKKSRMLLLNPELSIGEIAERTGFSDSNYFCRQFRKHYGVSPRNSRKESRISGNR